MLVDMVRIVGLIMFFSFAVAGCINLWRFGYWQFILFVIANVLICVPLVVGIAGQYDTTPEWARSCLWIGTIFLSVFTFYYRQYLQPRGITLWTVFFAMSGTS